MRGGDVRDKARVTVEPHCSDDGPDLVVDRGREITARGESPDVGLMDFGTLVGSRKEKVPETILGDTPSGHLAVDQQAGLISVEGSTLVHGGIIKPKEGSCQKRLPD